MLNFKLLTKLEKAVKTKRQKCCARQLTMEKENIKKPRLCTNKINHLCFLVGRLVFEFPLKR